MLRQSRDDARRAHDELSEDVRRLTARIFGDGGGAESALVNAASNQAHAAVSAAIAPVQSHLERELAVVRRHVAALRAGGSYASVRDADVNDALTSERPSCARNHKGGAAGAIPLVAAAFTNQRHDAI